MTASPQMLRLFIKEEILSSTFGRAFQDSINRLNDHFPSDKKKYDPVSLGYSHCKQLQKHYHSFYTDHAHRTFLNDMTKCNSNYHKVRSLSIEGEAGGLFLIAGPQKQFKFTRQEFLTAAWLRLGIPFKRFNANYKCRCSGNSTLTVEAGVYAQHCFVCKYGNIKNQRHDSIRDIIYQLAKDAKVSQVTREPTRLFDTVFNDATGKPSQCRPDLLIKDLPYDDESKHRFYKDCILDVSVTYPATFNNINKNKASLVQGGASNYAFAQKRNKYTKISSPTVSSRLFRSSWKPLASFTIPRMLFSGD